MTAPRRIHLIGICGTAMASLAGMLRARGFTVTGSDAAAYPPMSDFLAAQGVAVKQPFAAANLEPAPDLIVVGNAISRGNVELEYALDHGLPLASLPQLLHDQFLVGRKTLVVAGTHGKTTTTSMLAWIFHTAGKRPSFLIGGIAENFGSSFAVEESEFFIVEGDEYDSAFFDKGPKFLHYFPTAAILTSVEFDHADIYKDLDAVKVAFQRLVNLVPRSGKVLAWDGADSAGATSTTTSSANIDACVARAFCPVERYGFSERAAWRIRDVRYEAARTAWKLQHDGKPWADLEFALAGQYNVLNATAASAMAANFGIAARDIAEALRTYKSVKRRLEVRAEVEGITIIDDFAHHPTAISESLKALRTRYGGRRLWAIFEPRSNTMRRAIFQQELTSSLALADEVVIASIFKPESIAASDRLDVGMVVAELKRLGRSAVQLADASGIVENAAPRMRSGDVIAILSNGGFGRIYEKLPARLRELSGATQPKGEKANVKA